MTKLVLVDGSSYLFRAYHALPPLTNKDGEPTGAMYGVLNMLRKLVRDETPDYIGVVFDTKGTNFRHEIFPEYKANRPEMPEDLASQIQPLHDIIRAQGLPLIAIEGMEADDVIGTLAHIGQAHDMEVIISTGDKDFAQLVNDNITCVNTMTGKIMDIAGVNEKFGVTPEQIIDYLALMGDSVDNIPGIPKVGPKTAQKWLNQYDSIDNLLDHQDEIKGKIGENLRNNLEQLALSQKLVTIRTDMDINLSPEELKATKPDNTKLQQYFSQYEFKTWLKELGSTPQAVGSECEYITIFDEKILDEWIKDIKRAKSFVIDTETTSLDPFAAELVGISLCYSSKTAAYIPLAHDYEGAPVQLELTRVLAKLKPVLEDNEIGIIGQNIKYDRQVLAKYDINLNNVIADTMLMSYVLNSTATRHDMDSLAAFYLGRETIKYEDVAGKGAKQITFDKVAVDVAAKYAAEDAEITLLLYNTLWEKINDEPKLKSVFAELEMPLEQVISRMEQIGVRLDSEFLNQQSEDLAKNIAELEQQAYTLAGDEFNIASPKQLQEILYDKLSLPVLARTPKGAPSTAENVLQDLAHEYELPKIILSYRSLSKLKSTYTDKLPLEVNADTGRVHTSYHQAVTATGRLSSSDPNLQNIPIRTPEGRKIRQAFIPLSGYKLMAADYSQIELRIMAHLSNDRGLLKAFKNGEDIHRYTASELFQIEMDKVDTNQRRFAKVINFGLIYGMSAFGLARQLEIPQKEAQAYINHYFERYPGVLEYMENIRAAASKQGYVETLFGRRLYLPDINAKNVPLRKQSERVAINAPMQGTAADIIKQAMINIDKVILDNNWDVKMIMQVHDELVFEIPESLDDKIITTIIDNMQNAATLKVPLIVDTGIGNNWDEAH